ncbi:MFS general substrate transporter [Tilletiaria anomala UBC 951]|uniref:MFS general substrate transporter n=1 Tax=Tilletiaria anomala (strain ATCC 24038 / CBS 436.72 / UBC 951) TaxID=1037660 RepID=A0A066VSP8_TILAU|nr:MFS general substrate transporter [Tilletiaria anomala UBC 951]KDN41595.1 MFS general substrate transporter [Tilletiaria anomala UBC 951]
MLEHCRPNDEKRREFERKLVRKIDLRMMPILILLYIMNYLDRNNISAARDYGLQKDLKLTDTQYSVALSILFVGYISLQIPSNLLLVRLGRPRLYIPSIVALWGIVSGMTALTHNYSGLLAVRIVLGMAEAPFFPGALFLLSKWMTKKELATRTALLFSGSILSNAFSGLIAAGLLKLDGLRGIAGWKWMFIVEATLTVCISVIAFFVLPDFPENSSFLSEEERSLAVARLTEDAGEADVGGGDANGHGNTSHGLLLAVKDLKVYLLAVLLTAVTAGLSFNAFFPTLTGTLGYGQTQTLLLTVPPWFFAFVCVYFNGRHADATQERFLHISLPLVVGIAGFIISASTMNTAARFVGLFLMAPSYAGYVVILTWISNTIHRPTTKRAVALAGINAFSQLGNIAGSYIWQKKKFGPRYWQSNLICTCMFLVGIALALAMRVRLARDNRALDRKYGTVEETQASEGGKSTAHLTKRKFRYLL